MHLVIAKRMKKWVILGIEILRRVGIRYQAEICLKGHPRRAAMFDRKTDAKIWIQKEEANIRCDRQQLT